MSALPGAPPVPGAEARHQIANLLHTYAEIADRKDVGAAVALLGASRVVFPTGGFDRPGDAEAFFASCGRATPRTATTCPP